jgi:Holliday junction resolvasome RuvABC endonuclease subunit
MAEKPETLLALDLGTTCGWCVHSHNRFDSGVWDLRGSRYEGGGMRFVRFREKLNLIWKGWERIDRVAYEEVRRHLGVDAAHVYGGFQAMLSAWCDDQRPPVPYEGIPVGTIKRLATGKGNANKTAVLAAAQAKWPYRNIRDHNEADACWIAACVVGELKKVCNA